MLTLYVDNLKVAKVSDEFARFLVLFLQPKLTKVSKEVLEMTNINSQIEIDFGSKLLLDAVLGLK